MHRSTRAALGAAAAALATLAAAGSAAAETSSTSVTIVGGDLAYTTPLSAGTFPQVKLNGLPQMVKANISKYVVTDARGNGQGWNLTVQASQFSDGNGNTLPSGSLRMVDVPTPLPGAPLGGVIPPLPAVPLNPIDSGSPQRIVTADALPLSGMGEWSFTPTTGALVLTVPPDATPGTYTSTITTTLSTGP
jgi:hypothetical protein